MAFRKPTTTLGGLIWWDNISQNEYFIIQKHKVGLPVWPYKYRITMRENRMEIANSNDFQEISMDWEYLKKYAVPQIEEKIDIGKSIKDIDAISLISLISKITIGI